MFAFRLIVGVMMQLAIFGGLLFLPAGTLHWWRAWVFLGLVIIGTLATMVAVFPGRRDLFEERFQSPIQKGQPFADKVITILLFVTYFGLTVLIPLDVFRLHLMGKPGVIASPVGLAVFFAGWTIITLSFRANAFAAPVVKHQEDRHQTVVTTGPYAIVRHPMYAGGVLVMIGMPLWLESSAAAVASAAPIATIVVRIVIEERFLQRELPGYDAYTRKVRYRLIPFIW
jgi:protein-S-isoprenylcysteine O-methyltransferase Ste14